MEAPTCKDIVNIWKERTDPLIYPSDMYPPYVMAMLKERYTPDDVMLQMYRGERLPTAGEQWTLAKSFRRTQLKDGNALRRQMWEYESDDDMGEDLGIAGDDQANLDEVAAGELEAGGGAAKEGGAEGGDKKAAGGDKADDKKDDGKGGAKEEKKK